MTRVWITGRGVLCPLGSTPEELADALEQRRSAVQRLPGDAALGVTPYHVVGAPLPAEAGRHDELDPAWSTSLTTLLDRTSVLALRAAQQAWADAGLAEGRFDPQRAGVAWGCGMGGTGTTEQAYRDLLAPVPRRLHPFTVVRAMHNAAASHIAILHNLQGPLMVCANACASSAQAIGEAMHWLRSGRADVVIAGGAETPLAPGVVRAWQAMGVLARADAEQPETSCRPFDRRRSGLVLAEGAGALVLEREAHARARGARPLAVLAGYGASNDAVHLSRPDAAGQVRAMRQALAEAGLHPAEVGHVNAHGTGTPVGDAVEARSVHEVFGAHRPAVSAGKALHGHLIGAAGAVEAIAALEALRRGRVPPTAHLRDNDCTEWVDVVTDRPRDLPLQAVLSNSFAFGGANAALVMAQA